MAPPHSNYHIQGVPRIAGAVTVLSHHSEPAIRTSTRLEISNISRSSSSASLPSLKTSSRVLSLNLGVNNRRSAIRSLANNPRLSVNVVGGRVSVLRRNGLTGSPAAGVTGLQEPVERIVSSSKDGYHPRSLSPTYETLSLAKSQLETLLSRRLREIRKDFDGQTARQNSAVFSEISSEAQNMEESWYLRAIEADEDLSAIETTRVTNEDYATSLETISTSCPVPQRPIKFSSTVLKENICNPAILDINEKETKTKLDKWRQNYATDIPKLERLDSSPVMKRRQCLSDLSQLIPEERFEFLRRTSRSVEPAKTKTFKRKPKFRKAKHVIVEEQPEPEPNLPKAEKIIEEIKPKEPPKQLPVVNDEVDEVRKSLPYVSRPEKEEDVKKYEPQLILDETQEPYESDKMKVLRQPSIKQPTKMLNSIDPIPTADHKDEVAEEDKPGEPLTAKEKFLKMQERMQKRKLERQKTRDSFEDYSFMMYNQSKEKGGVDLNKLGVTLSKRLENMTTFKSTLCDDSDDDDDDGDVQLELSDSEDDVNK